MTAEEREKLNALRQRVADEQDPLKFLDAVTELNNLLELKAKRIIPQPPRAKDSSS